MIPGVLMALIYDAHTQHKQWDNFKYILMSLVFGVITYLTMQLIIFIFQLIAGISDTKNINWMILSIWSITDQKENITTNPLEILFGSFTAVFLGLFAVWLNSKRTFHNLLIKLHISNKYGDDNVFIRTIEEITKDDCSTYILLIDENITMHGFIKFYNESEKTQEISLEQVTIYSSDKAEILFKTNFLYVSKEFGKMILFKDNVEVTDNDD